eukprot:SAG11_NODE_7868_length_1086_cov_1.407295_2_plen_46_part_01
MLSVDSVPSSANPRVSVGVVFYMLLGWLWFSFAKYWWILLSYLTR